MSDMNRSFAGEMPEFYDRFLVPMMFAPFAQDLARRFQGTLSGHVLELAAGTGIVTRAMARTLPAAVAMTATDLNPAMLVQAKSHAGLERVQWQEADALSLPFADQQFDYIVCQFGVMFFPDKVAGFREALRVLRSGGRFLFSVWGDRFPSTVSDVVVTVVGRFLSRDPESLVSPPYNDVARCKPTSQPPGLRRSPPRTLSDRLIPGRRVKPRSANATAGSSAPRSTRTCLTGLMRSQTHRRQQSRPGLAAGLSSRRCMRFCSPPLGRADDGDRQHPLATRLLARRKPNLSD